MVEDPVPDTASPQLRYTKMLNVVRAAGGWVRLYSPT